MAWDLRYTSVESGPTGRSGFQFVATTPGTPPEVTRAVTPYMSYRPPPDAPSAPSPEQLAGFPVAFAYGREGDHTVLVRCRYTGRDYSGRYGNFSGHAVVATPAEMEGLRPIELWASPVWSGPPGGTPDLVPGEVFDPDSLVAWLGREGAHARLAALLDAVTSALAGGHGRVVLVSEDDGLIARWIALLSYSLPAGLAAAMSFTTYTAAPESAPQLLVGTVPGAWPGRAFHLDEPAVDPPGRDAPGRFARVVAECWRTGDLDGIDAVGELLTAATGPNGEWNTGAQPSDAWKTGVRPGDPWNTGAQPSGAWNTGVRPDGPWGTGVRPDDTPQADQASGDAPRTPDGRWDTTSGTTTPPPSGKGRGARLRPTRARGGPGAADGGARTRPTGADGMPGSTDRMGGSPRTRPAGPGGGPGAADDSARTPPTGASGKPDGTGGNPRTPPTGASGIPDGTGGNARTRPTGASGKPDGTGGNPRTPPTGASGIPDGTGGNARTRPTGASGKPDGTGGNPRTPPTGASGIPDETGGNARTRPTGASGISDGTGGNARTRPTGASGKPDGTGGNPRTPSTGAGSVLDAADGAAALLALCRGDTTVSAEEEAAAAELVRRGGAPAWIWPSLSDSLPRLGFELAAALASAAPQIAEHCVTLALADPAYLDRMPTFRLRDGLPSRFRTAVAEASGLDALAAVVRLADQVGGRIENEEVTAAAAACTRRGAGGIAESLRATPGAWRGAMVSGVLAGLETAGAPIRRAMLDHDAVEALGDHDWKRAPRTGGLVLSARADRHEATAGLVELEPYGLPDIEDLLTGLWEAPPTPADCVRLIERLGSDLTRFAVLRRLPRRVFETAPLDAEETVRLAELVRDRLPALAGPARIVLAHGEALRAEPEREVARVLGLLDSADPLTGRVCASVAGALTRRPARSRADILAAASDTVRSGLAGHWLDADLDKRARVDLAEIEVRLHHARKPVARLTAWGDGLGRFARRHVESALTDRDPELASAWRALRRRGA